MTTRPPLPADTAAILARKRELAPKAEHRPDDPDRIRQFTPGVNAYCELRLHQTGPHPQLPFTPALAWCVEWLVPFQEGLFTDGTMPELLVAALEEAGRAYPEERTRPVLAFLPLDTARKYERFFGPRCHVESYDMPVRGETVHMAAIWMEQVGWAAVDGREGLRARRFA